MTRLLVSVRNADEARAALAGGADVIDVKEPTRGSLGAATNDTMAEVLAEVNDVRPVSAALGELLDHTIETHLAIPSGLTFVKFGLAGCANVADWRARLRFRAEALPDATSLVAVIYADHHAAEAPTSEEILDAAVEWQCDTILVDTWNKADGSLLAIWSFDQIARLIERVHATGKKVALAGSLTRNDVARVLCLEPDYVAVRGAACEAGRTSAISTERVQALADRIHFPLAASLATRSPAGRG
jgi:uncharacterized protein (UPF0264 family)